MKGFYIIKVIERICGSIVDDRIPRPEPEPPEPEAEE